MSDELKKVSHETLMQALQEAKERREAEEAAEKAAAERGGPSGAEPTRYGDWEVGGRACDF